MTSGQLMAAQRQYILDMMLTIESSENYRLPRAIDLFMELSSAHQKNLLNFIVEQNPQPGWLEMTGDSTQYIDLLKSILYYYTGRDDATQPTKEQLKKLVGSYCKTSAFKEAHGKPATASFMDVFEEEVKP